MGRGNQVLLNVSGGEISPEMYARIDLPIYQRGNQRIQNYIVLPQGGLQYRPGFKHVHNTRSLATGRLISFSFSESDTYILEFTDKKLRFYRNLAAVLETTSATITSVTKANPAVVTTSAAHNLLNDDEVYIAGIVGMPEINNQFFIVKNKTATTFELANIYGTLINASAFTAAATAGTATKPYEITTPYASADLQKLHTCQSADTLRITHQKYPSFTLTRTDHTKWFPTTAALSNRNVVTSVAGGTEQFTCESEHGLSVNDFVYVIEASGLTPDVNNQYWKVKDAVSAKVFTLKDTNNGALNITDAGYVAGSMKLFHAQQRIADPFNQQIIQGVTQANPGVVTTQDVHNFNVDDEVFITEVGGMTQINDKLYFVKDTPTDRTFGLKDSAGANINTTSFTAWRTGGFVIQTKKAPKTAAFLDSSRLVYGNIPENPAGLYFSRAPSSTTGATRFDDFTTGSNATDAVLYTLGPVFDKQDAVQWITMINKQPVVGCASSIRRVHGDTIDDPISPSSIRATPINNAGANSVEAFSDGQSIYYVDYLGNRLQSFQFAIQSNDFVTLNQNLASSQLGSSNFIEVAQQRGDSGLLWVLRADGVLLGLTFSQVESIFGWHRHYIGGSSVVSSVTESRAKVLSIAVEPRANDEAVLWVLVERKVGTNTYRSVEYLTEAIRFVELEDFFTESTYEAQATDVAKYNSAVFEQLKGDIHLDSAISYDGSADNGVITMTPSATSGNITLTASAAFFTASMVGKQIWKKYDTKGAGGGRAEITSFTSPTVVNATVLSNFNNTTAIPATDWFLTAKKVFGLLHMVGETLTAQLDGAPGVSAVIASDGSFDMTDHASKAAIGYKYNALSSTMNLDVAGERGSAQAKIRKIRRVLPRFKDTAGGKIGTTPWNAEALTFRALDDLTDRPTPLFNGINEVIPADSWTRQTKQVVLIQDIPSPQILLSMDIEVETADD